MRSQEFSPYQESSQTLPSFSPCSEGTENMFYFFYKIVIIRLKQTAFLLMLLLKVRPLYHAGYGSSALVMQTEVLPYLALTDLPLKTPGK